MSSFVTMPSPWEFIKESLPWALVIPKMIYLTLLPHWKFLTVVFSILLIMAYFRYKVDKRISKRIEVRKKEELADVIAEGIRRSKQ